MLHFLICRDNESTRQRCPILPVLPLLSRITRSAAADYEAPVFALPARAAKLVGTGPNKYEGAQSIPRQQPTNRYGGDLWQPLMRKYNNHPPDSVPYSS